MRRGKREGEGKWKKRGRGEKREREREREESDGGELLPREGRQKRKRCKRRGNSSLVVDSRGPYLSLFLSLSLPPPPLPYISLSPPLSLFLSVWSSWYIELGSRGRSPTRARHRPQTSCRDVVTRRCLCRARDTKPRKRANERASERAPAEARDDVERYDSLSGSQPLTSRVVDADESPERYHRRRRRRRQRHGLQCR